MTTAVILLAVALTVLVALYVFQSVQFSRTLQISFRASLIAQQAQQRSLDKLLDRFMASNFQEFKAYESLAEAEGYVEEEVETTVLPPSAASPLSSASSATGSESPTAEFPAEYPPPPGMPLIRGERWIPPEERGIAPDEERGGT